MGANVKPTLLIGWGIASCLALQECTTVPTLDEATGGIPVYDIVLRTKCELSSAFQGDDGTWLPDTNKKLAWLQNWTAQADLTLQVLNQATLSPGVTFMQPFHNAYPTAVGPSNITTSGALGTTISGVSQSFAVAAGASLNGQAQRTETMSFAFSVKELKEWRFASDTERLCSVSDNMDLRGRLGLREWFRQAAWPVVSRDELLYAGYHPKPANASGSPQQSVPKAQAVAPPQIKEAKPKGCTRSDLDKLLADLDSVQDTLDGASELAKQAKNSFDTAANNQKSDAAALQKAEKTLLMDKQRFNAVLDPAVRAAEDDNIANVKLAKRFAKKAADNIADARDDLKELDPLPGTIFSRAKILVRNTKAAAERSKNDLSNCNMEALSSDLEEARALATAALGDANAAMTNISRANDNIKNMKTYIDTATEFTSKAIDPPIATIGQSVQFILVYGANGTPTWTFVTFKGPNAPLLSATGTRTHTLNITLGPVNPETNAPNADVKQNQFYLQLNSVLSPLLP